MAIVHTLTAYSVSEVPKYKKVGKHFFVGWWELSDCSFVAFLFNSSISVFFRLKSSSATNISSPLQS